MAETLEGWAVEASLQETTLDMPIAKKQQVTDRIIREYRQRHGD